MTNLRQLVEILVSYAFQVGNIPNMSSSDYPFFSCRHGEPEGRGHPEKTALDHHAAVGSS